jgi:hypothetical protein
VRLGNDQIRLQFADQVGVYPVQLLARSDAPANFRIDRPARCGYIEGGFAARGQTPDPRRVIAFV